MRIYDERHRGNIDDSTDIVNDGEYIAYAEVDYGPWTIEYEREREGSQYSVPKPERVTVKGPFMGEEQEEMEATIGVWNEVTEAIDTWDYIEAADKEVYMR